MSISSETNRIQFNGDGTTVAFAVSFYFIEDSHLQVILTSSAGVDTVQTITTEYTVVGSGNFSGGTLTMVTAPASGEKLTIKRNVPKTQQTDYVENDPFPAETHEQALDKLTMLSQQTDEEVSRSLKAPTSSEITDGEIPAADVVANYVLRINAAATGFEAVTATEAALSGTLTPTDGNFIVGDGTDFVTESGATARTSIGLGTGNSPTFTAITATGTITGASGTWDSGGIDIAASDSYAVAGTSILSDNSGTMTLSNIDALDATTEATIESAIDTLSNLTSIGTIGTGVWQATDVGVSYGGTGASTAEDARTNLGVVIGTDVQAQDTDLQTIADAGAVNFGGFTSFEIPNGTGPTTNAAGEIALDTDGNGSTITTGVLQIYDGTQNTFGVSTTNYPTTDNDVPAYDSGTNSVVWQAQIDGGGGLTDIVDDVTPQLGGDLDTNSFNIQFDDAKGIRDSSDNEHMIFQLTASAVNYLEVTNNSTGNSPSITANGSDAAVGLLIDTKGTGTLALGSADSVLTMDGSGISGTLIKDEDTLTSDSATHLATQQSIKAYVDASGGGGGKVLQVISTAKTNTFSVSSSTYTDITGFSASITPASTSNKVLIVASLQVSGDITGFGPKVKLLRDSTAICVGDAASSRDSTTGGSEGRVAGTMASMTVTFLDSPSTTSATTYKFQMCEKYDGSVVYLNRSATDSDSAIYPRTASTITVFEIDGT